MKPLSFRQSNAWLHTWSGLVVGWLLYVIFFTGTLSFFQQEISVWMKPEQHAAYPHADSPLLLLNKANELAPDAQRWSINLPTERNNASQLFYLAKGEKNTRGAGTSLVLDPSTGDTIEPRATRGGSFLYRFHFQLYGLPVLTARWLVALATMFMLVAIISGVITHKKIFKDFFTFRPAKGQRSWLDAHNATAVLALPFHFMITYSGLLLLMFLFMPYGLDKAYDGNTRAFFNESEVFSGRFSDLPKESTLTPQPMSAFAPLLTDVQTHFTRPISSIRITSPNTAQAQIEFRESGANSILNRGQGARLIYDGQGNLQEKIDAQPLAISSAIYNVFTSLHLIRFAEAPLRWLFFISGWIGTAMVATGLIIWVSKRQAQLKKGAQLPRNIRMIQWLNIGTITGLALATLGYFYANRLLPTDVADRSAWEINLFFLVWLACFIHPMFRTHKQAWQEQLLLCSLFSTLLVLYNFLFSPFHLFNSAFLGQWIVFGFDAFLLVFAAFSYWGYRKVNQHTPKQRKKDKTPKAEPAL